MEAIHTKHLALQKEAQEAQRGTDFRKSHKGLTVAELEKAKAAAQ
jgi:hypothetical protein